MNKNTLDIVEGIVTEHARGKHGLYMVAHSDQVKTRGGWITFDFNAWEEDPSKFPPKPGAKVLLKIHETTGGWRADEARFLRPSDSESEPE